MEEKILDISTKDQNDEDIVFIGNPSGNNATICFLNFDNRKGDNIFGIANEFHEPEKLRQDK